MTRVTEAAASHRCNVIKGTTTTRVDVDGRQQPRKKEKRAASIRFMVLEIRASVVFLFHLFPALPHDISLCSSLLFSAHVLRPPHARTRRWRLLLLAEREKLEGQ